VKLFGKPYEAHLLAVIVLYLLGFAVYLNSFSVPFIFDDYPNILDNPSIRMTAVDFDNLHAAAVESHASRRPIANVSFALNYLAGGYDVKGYHLVNILIHVVNGVLVYFVCLILLNRNQALVGQRTASSRRMRLVALLAAAVFIAHPVQVQAVTYIVQRMTSMATMFYLMSLLLYLLGRQREDWPGRGAYWSAAFALWLLALHSKEIAATLPIVLVMIEYFLFRGSRKAWAGLHPGVLLFSLMASIGVVFLYLGSDPGASIAAQYTEHGITPGERLLTELRVVVFYLSLLVLPLPSRLSLEHTFAVSHGLTDPISTLIAATFLLALIITAARLCRRHPILSLCITWFLITLSIESSFIGLELAFEHRLYLPMFGFALATAYLFSLTPVRHRTIAIGFGGAMVVALAAASIARNTDWQDAAVLWADTASKNPSSYRAQNNLGRALMQQDKHEQAEHAFNEALRLNPQYPEPHNNLGSLHARAGRFDQAYAHFAAAIELNPRYAQAFNNLGVALLNQGLAQEAALQLAEALRLAPRYAKAHANLSVALLRLGEMQTACRHYRMALELDPAATLPQTVPGRCGQDSNAN